MACSSSGQADNFQINDDFDVAYPSAGGTNHLTPAEDPRNKRKIRELVQKYPITVSYVIECPLSAGLVEATS
jgi:hypothetical protein